MKAGSNLERILSEGKFAATAELGPPKSADAELVHKKADLLKGKVDAVNITDNQTAIVRMSSIGAAKLTLDKGLEPVMQMVCRDRNRIAIQSDVLGAYALGIRNMLCLTGDHQKFGNHPSAKNVFDIDSIQLLHMMKNMRDEKVFQCGEEIRNTKKAPIVEPKMLLGAAENPFAHPYEYRAVRLAKKVNAGADFIQTQCVFDVPRFKEWMKEVVDLGLHEKVFILAGVMPVKSAGQVNYMKKNVAGMSIPDELVDRMKGASDPKEEGVNFVVELINEVKQIEGIRGVHIMAVEWEEIVPTIVERAGLLPRP
ncbi:MAG: methylenetetrahydrofolate reductase [Candidatus Hydrogenedentota bacterium]|nr:MAG: methylenetetrahydrofolate reductase [Candidatus Hydrogenedentota bacterium]